MCSTHPPLESLLKLSHTCLESFELTSLNRIANLRKEFRQVLGEWIELEIGARFAHWALECRNLGDSFPNTTALPAFVPSQLALRSVVHVSEQLLLPSGDELPIEFPFASMVEIGDSVAFELGMPHRCLPVSQDAAAALRSLEHLARLEARSIGDQSTDLLNRDALDSSLPFPPYTPRESVHELRSVSARMSYVFAGTKRAVHYIVRYSSTFVTSDRPTSLEPIALSEVNVSPHSRPVASRSSCEFAFALRRTQSDPCRTSPFQLSPRQLSLRRTAVLLRN
jgi:hypothetical protein